MKTDLAVGEAGSLLWAARHLQDRLNVLVKLPNPNSVAVELAGCFFSAILLRAFAAEVALKGLYCQETGKDPDRSHDLSVLFNQLKPGTRHSLDRRFQRRRRVAPHYDGRTNTIGEVFSDHKGDFVHWRYIFEKQGNSHVEVLDLEPAVEAIVEEYGDNMMSGDKPD